MRLDLERYRADDPYEVQRENRKHTTKAEENTNIYLTELQNELMN